VPSGDLGLAVDPAWPGGGQGLGGDLGPALGPGGDLGLVVDLGLGVDKKTTQIYNAQTQLIRLRGQFDFRMSCFPRSAFVDAWKGSNAYVSQDFVFCKSSVLKMNFLKLSACVYLPSCVLCACHRCPFATKTNT